MTPTTERVNQVLTWIEGIARETEAFAREQTPLLVREILLEPWIRVGMYLPLSVVACVITFLVARWFKKMPTATNDDWGADPAVAIASVFTALGACIAWGFVLYHFVVAVQDAVQATLTPRLYLLEWVQRNV